MRSSALILGACLSSVLSAVPVSAQDTLSLFVGPDGSKQPQDLGINANMGIRFSGNVGFPVAKGLGIGAQVGAACNLSDAAVHVLDQIEGTSRRSQVFLTFGAFGRSTGPVSWGVAYDLLFEQYYDDFELGQLRGEVGYKATAADEIGVWFTKSTSGADAVMGDVPVRLDPISMGNVYYRRTWAAGARTSVWGGLAAGHGNIVWVLPDNSRDEPVFVYGAELQLPLSSRLEITGAANFLTPTATGTVDAYLGVTFYPGKSGANAATSTFAPLLGVANNPSMAVDLRR